MEDKNITAFYLYELGFNFSHSCFFKKGNILVSLNTDNSFRNCQVVTGTGYGINAKGVTDRQGLYFLDRLING